MRNFSFISTGLALICAVHCALTPILLSLMPLIAGEIIAYHWVEWLMVGASGLIGGLPLLKGYREHRSLLPICMMLMGLGLVLLEHAFHLHILLFVPSLIGALLLIMAQVYNLRLKRLATSRVESAG